jgi:prolyl-tRNA synthetase
MPDGRVIQQPSTHFMGQKFSKVFDAKFKNEKGQEEYLWTTAYGPAMSRILVSVISVHGDNKGLVLPFAVSPVQIIIIPIFTTKNKEKILKESENIKKKIEAMKLKVEIDKTEKRPGEKYYEWELRGVPFRLEIGEKEIKNKELILFIRDLKKKEKLPVKNISRLKEYGKKFDDRLRKTAENLLKKSIADCKTKDELKRAMKNNKIARINWCSLDKKGEKCAEYVEKELQAEVRGTLANKKEKPAGKCIICNKQAKEVVYIAKSY